MCLCWIIASSQSQPEAAIIACVVERQRTHAIHQESEGTLRHCFRALTLFLGTETVVDDADALPAHPLWVPHHLRAELSHCSFYLHAILG